MRQTFKNTRLNKTFEKDGYIKIDFLSSEECDSLMKQYKSFDAKVDAKFYTTFWSENLEYRTNVNKCLKDILMKKLNELVINYRPIFSNFMVKLPGEGGECLPHQDWNYVDEQEGVSLTIWCALSDMDDSQGCLRVFPGSHKLDNKIRGRNITNYLEHVQPMIRKYFMKKTSLKKGQALIVNSALIHGSENNQTNKERIAVALMSVPNEVECIHYATSSYEDNIMRVFSGEQNLFVDHSCFEELNMLDSKKSFLYEKEQISKYDVMKIYLKNKLS